MKISVAMCSYNGEKHLLAQLKSIESQTRKPDELIVCDDTSTDKTLDILYSFKKICPFPMHVHENESQLGSTRNFEKAIRLCGGDIIALSDQDDVWRPDKLKKIADEFDKSPDIGYVFSDAELVDDDLTHLHRTLWETLGFQGLRYKQYVKGDQFSCLFRRNIVTGATMAFRSSLKNLVLPFPRTTSWLHDGWIALIASSAGKKGRPLPEPLIMYRQHSRQQVGAPRALAILNIFNIYHVIKILRLQLEHLSEAEERSYPILRERLMFIQTNGGLNTEPALSFLERRKIKPFIARIYRRFNRSAAIQKDRRC